MSNPASADGNAVLRFNRLWEEYAGSVLAYVKRRVDITDTDDVLSETYLVAWRRIDEVPSHALPWLLVVARNTIANRSRTGRRRDRVSDQYARLQSVAQAGVDVAITDRDEVLAVLASLTDGQREAILLTAWDGLTVREAADVSGCTPATFHVRLHRARRAIETATTSPAIPANTQIVRS